MWPPPSLALRGDETRTPEHEERDTNLIFLLLQLSQARCVLVRFLGSGCPPPGVEEEPVRGVSPVESGYAERDLR